MIGYALLWGYLLGMFPAFVLILRTAVRSERVDDVMDYGVFALLTLCIVWTWPVLALAAWLRPYVMPGEER